MPFCTVRFHNIYTQTGAIEGSSICFVFQAKSDDEIVIKISMKGTDKTRHDEIRTGQPGQVGVAVQHPCLGQVSEVLAAQSCVWHCSKCTYLNEPDALNCAMCLDGRKKEPTLATHCTGSTVTYSPTKSNTSYESRPDGLFNYNNPASPQIVINITQPNKFVEFPPMSVPVPAQSEREFAGSWTCSVCTIVNSGNQSICPMCDAWSCKKCTFRNLYNDLTCQCCSTSKTYKPASPHR